MLAKMALQLSRTTHEVAEFSGDMLVTGVRFIFNKFPPSNIVVRRFHTLRSHRIFSIGKDNPHVGKALDR